MWENPEKKWDISGSELEQKLGGETHSKVAGIYSVHVSERLGYVRRRGQWRTLNGVEQGASIVSLTCRVDSCFDNGRVD